MTLSMSRRLDDIEPSILAMSGKLEKSVYGVVDRVDGNGKIYYKRKWRGTIGKMEATDETPTISIIEKLEPMILKHKKHKCMYGGRAGTKSIFAMNAMIGDVNSNASKVFVLRERMKSLRNSIYAGIESQIKTLGVSGFRPVPSLWEIKHKAGGLFSFGGLQNVIDMKGMFKYKFFLLEEAARTSQHAIDVLGPTLRGVPGAELWYVWNNESSNDPMSIQFINPYQSELDKCGYYEDEHHMVIKVGYRDNPWFEYDQSLREEHAKDLKRKNSGLMSASRYNHMWEGAMNDDISNSVIETDWFDACIDAHKREGFAFEAKGAVVAACDPSDTGKDATGFIVRHGSVVYRVEEIDGIDGNRKFDIACREAKHENADSFGWDCDGMGALLRDQASAAFAGTKVHTFMYKGSESINMPEAIFEQAEDYSIKGEKRNKDVFRNKKAQNIIKLASRIRRTYDFVVNGSYHHPDSLISFDSETISPEMMAKLRSEACRTPLKPSDTISFYTKEEMRRGIPQSDGSSIKIPSPNLFDPLVLSWDDSSIIHNIVKVDLSSIRSRKVNHW